MIVENARVGLALLCRPIVTRSVSEEMSDVESGAVQLGSWFALSLSGNPS